ncbi:MAG: hypothetical protein IPG07_13180 [Crocinitomicaceae bacterium]|nr:hypothetical protein [Crocinitomicaceae bacterium]
MIIEAASSWADGYDYNHWLQQSLKAPASREGKDSFTDVGLNYFYFAIMKFWA